MNPRPIQIGSPSRRTFLGGLAALALAPALAACGSDGETSASGSDAAGGAFPATVEHKFGRTTVTKAPKRVVCVGLVEQDALLALGIVPVATSKWFGEAPGFIFPWATDALGEAELPKVIDPSNGIPVEEVAGLAPDLIVGIYSGMTQQEYDLLSKIAPTVAQPEKYVDYGTPWDETTQMIGDAVGRPEEAKKLIEDVNATIAGYREDHPEFEGKKVGVVTPWEGLFVYGPEDPRGRLLDQLGFVFPEELADPKSKEFGWSLSAENTSKLEALDAVVWISVSAADKGMTALWEKTTPFEEGRWVDIEEASGAYYVGHSFVTPLSIPWMLERYVPQLAAAVDGDPATKPPVVKD